MVIVKSLASLSEVLDFHRRNGSIVGFVPTMGALHTGHTTLINESAAKTDFTVCSIFVNPTQFNDPSDFERYPRDVAKDIHLLAGSSSDLLFLPSVEEVYPSSEDRSIKYELGALETILEGKYRPGHFQGVARVMYRLLEMVAPDKLFMGLKDYQQCMVVAELIRKYRLPGTLIPVPTVREADGLAKSSRNLRLSPEQRKLAPAIFREMIGIRDSRSILSLAIAKERAMANLQAEGFKVDYLEIARKDTLEPVTSWEAPKDLVILAAAFLGDIRLIDNLFLSS